LSTTFLIQRFLTFFILGVNVFYIYGSNRCSNSVFLEEN